MVEQPGTVYVIDDDPSVREALKSLLRSVGLTVLPFASTQDFVKSKRPESPACLVLDVRMPGLSGLDFQHQLAHLQIELPVIFITGHADVPMSVRAMKSGAVEFLSKPFRDQDLLDAIHVGLEKDRARRAAAKDAADLRRRFDSLTAREREVMALVAAGRLNKEVAAELGVTEVTVKVHRGQAMRKMAAASLADLVRMSDALGMTIGTPQRPLIPKA